MAWALVDAGRRALSRRGCWARECWDASGQMVPRLSLVCIRKEARLGSLDTAQTEASAARLSFAYNYIDGIIFLETNCP